MVNTEIWQNRLNKALNDILIEKNKAKIKIISQKIENYKKKITPTEKKNETKKNINFCYEK